VKKPDVAAIAWLPAYRIIPSRFPPIALFERVAPAEDWDALIELESLTNPRLRQEIGAIDLVPREERVSGPGMSVVMAAFTHPSPTGSRFNDAGIGAFYCTPDLATAIAETKFHRERFMRATGEAAQHLDMRVYLVDLQARLHDIRGKQRAMAAVYDGEDYAAGQALAKKLRAAGSEGVVYSSVRRDGGECAAVFRPTRLGNCRQERHLAYVWDGAGISAVYEKREMEG
jgi:hypothetical protein